MAKQPKLRIIPLGGLGEIGKNMTVFEMGSDAIIIDTGVMFPANDMHGVDYIIPDFNYLRNRHDLKIHGIVYTHGHEDHTGAVAHVVEAFPGTPIYATPLTAGMLEVKLRDNKLMDRTALNTFVAGDTITVGPFVLESFHVCHSIPQCVGFALQTPFGLVVHTGDYKFDNAPVDGKLMDVAKLADFNRRGVMLLMGDSTNATSPGWTPSESVINDAFDRVFKHATGRIIVATFASLISRVQQVVWAAQRYKRKVAIAGYSMNRNIEMAIKLGLLQVPDGMLISDINKLDTFRPHEVVVMVTGSQGEPSSVLNRMSQGKHRLEVDPGDTIVISAHSIPGNEENVSRIINNLFRRGANVIYDPIEQVHVSGHGNQEDLRLMLTLLQPKYVLPIHGELRMLYAHKQLAVGTGVPADNVFIAENGMVIEVDKVGVRKTNERVPGGYVYVDGSGVGDIGRAVIQDRRILGSDGFMVVVADIDRRTGRIVGEPEIISRGFIYLRDAGDLLNQVRDKLQETIRGANGTSTQALRERVENNVAQMLFDQTRRRPMVFTVLNER